MTDPAVFSRKYSPSAKPGTKLVLVQAPSGWDLPLSPLAPNPFSGFSCSPLAAVAATNEVVSIFRESHQEHGV